MSRNLCHVGVVALKSAQWKCTWNGLHMQFMHTSERVIFSYWPRYSFTMECKSNVMSATAFFFSGWPTYWAITTHTYTQIVCGCVCLYNICVQKLLWLKGGYRDLFGRAAEGLFFSFLFFFWFILFFWVSLDLYFILAFPCKILG